MPKQVDLSYHLLLFIVYLFGLRFNKFEQMGFPLQWTLTLVGVILQLPALIQGTL